MKISIESQIQISNFFHRVQGGELFERVIDEDFVLTERACACFMKQICEAMEYLHNHKVIHLDMKVMLKKFLL
jgi:myosin-light-chain kinase